MDLYHRIAILTLNVPPLRERREDIEEISSVLLEEMAPDVGRKKLSPIALDIMRARHWSGNVRELKNALYRSAAMAKNNRINASDLRLEKEERAQVVRKEWDEQVFLKFEEASDLVVLKMVERHRGNVAAAARELGLARTTLRDKLKRIANRSEITRCA